jgi:hypothetical protein
LKKKKRKLSGAGWKSSPRIIARRQRIAGHTRHKKDGTRYRIKPYTRHYRVWRKSKKPVRKKRRLPPEEIIGGEGHPPEIPPDVVAPLSWIQAQDLINQFLPEYRIGFNYENGQVMTDGFQDLPGWAHERRAIRKEMASILGKSWPVLPVWAIVFDHPGQTILLRSMNSEEEKVNLSGNTVTGWMKKQNLSAKARTVIEEYLDNERRTHTPPRRKNGSGDAAIL